MVELLSFFSLMTGWFLQVGPLTWKLQVGAMRTTSPAALTRNLQCIKDNDAGQSTKEKLCDTLPYLRVACVDPPCLRTAYFQKKMFVHARYFVKRCRANCVVKVLIVWCW